jgi:DNA-binding response OmpR family regulator
MENNTRLLLCEDDPNLGTLLAQYLKAKDYEVELCVDGDQGLAAYKKSKFDLLLLDVMMPLKDGFTLAREIRKNDTETPIIFLTAKNMRKDTITGFESGADDYLTKPFSMEELLLRIAAVLRRARGVEPPRNTTFNLGRYVRYAQATHRRKESAGSPRRRATYCACSARTPTPCWSVHSVAPCRGR